MPQWSTYKSLFRGKTLTYYVSVRNLTNKLVFVWPQIRFGSSSQVDNLIHSGFTKLLHYTPRCRSLHFRLEQRLKKEEIGTYKITRIRVYNAHAYCQPQHSILKRKSVIDYEDLLLYFIYLKLDDCVQLRYALCTTIDRWILQNARNSRSRGREFDLHDFCYKVDVIIDLVLYEFMSMSWCWNFISTVLVAFMEEGFIWSYVSLNIKIFLERFSFVILLEVLVQSGNWLYFKQDIDKDS